MKNRSVNLKCEVVFLGGGGEIEQFGPMLKFA